MPFQLDPPVEVYNGPTDAYLVKAAYDADGAVTQLVGVDDRWLDAFGRFRVSEPVTLFESSFTYDLQPLLYETTETTNGTVAHDTDTRSATLTVTADSGSLAAITSRQYHPYEKGRSQLIKLTFTFGAAVENVRRRAGYFDAANGFYLEQTSSAVSLVRRSSVTGSLVNTSVSQSNWNLDPLDGTGPSGEVLSLSSTQILVIDGQWLGVGRVRMGFNIGGSTIWAHEFLHANETATAPYTQTFALPVRWEIESTDASAGATLQAICAEVESEGGTANPTGFRFSAVNIAAVNTSTTRAAILSIRPAADFPASSGLVNRQLILPGSVSLLATGQATIVEVFYDCTLTGGTWTRAHANSAVEYGLGQTISAVGVPIRSFFVAAGVGQGTDAASGTAASQYPLTLDISGANPKSLTICATTVASTGTARASIDWDEIR